MMPTSLLAPAAPAAGADCAHAALVPIRHAAARAADLNAILKFTLILLVMDDPDWLAINRHRFSIDSKLYRRRAPQGPRKPRSIAERLTLLQSQTTGARSAFFSPSFPRCLSSIRHRENQQPIIGLIHDDRKIRKLIDGNPELRRPGKSDGLHRLQGIRSRIHEGGCLAREIGGQDRSSLRI